MSHKSTGLSLAWLGMARSIQNFTSNIYSKGRYGQFSFVYWIPVNRGSSRFNIFHRSSWLVFFPSFKWSYIIFNLINGSLINAEVLLLVVFVSKGPQNRLFRKFFGKLCHFIFCKTSKRRISVILDFPSQIAWLGKF